MEWVYTHRVALGDLRKEPACAGRHKRQTLSGARVDTLLKAGNIEGGCQALELVVGRQEKKLLLGTVSAHKMKVVVARQQCEMQCH